MQKYNNLNTVLKSFDENYLSKEPLQAQFAEIIELKMVIGEIYSKKQKLITILEIGIGNSRIAKHLSGIFEVCNMIDSYDGIDNSNSCVVLSNQIAKDLKIEDKLTVYNLDAVDLN